MLTDDPQPEIDIELSMVRKLIDNQYPEWTHLEIRFFDKGWDNEIFRLGDQFMVRMPRRSLAVPLLETEINWLSRLQVELPIPVPAPIAVGQPAFEYPWKWTITPWFEGYTANRNLPNNKEAGRLVEFLKALHGFDPTGAPANSHRDQPLTSKSPAVAERMKRLSKRTDLIKPAHLEIWKLALGESVPVAKTIIHGDLHPRNVIVSEGKLAAIIDWGDMTAGDPATDLASLWMLFDDEIVRDKSLQDYGVDASLITRARGWALFFGVTLLDTGLDSNEQHAAIGKTILERLLAPPKN